MVKTQSSLETSLEAALSSRDDRRIRRRLPDPNTSSSDSPLLDFNSNDYLSLSRSSQLREKFMHRLSSAPDVLGSGGSRLLMNGRAHSALEARLATFFKAQTALLFNSGFDANVGFFSCIPQSGDVIVFDEYIHASVHDGMRLSRVKDSARCPFMHNTLSSLRDVLLSKLAAEHPGLKDGSASVFVAVESLYSMDGTFSPLVEIVALLNQLFPRGNGYLVVDEAHATGIYGPLGRGRVAMLGLEDRVLARLHTFGKALAGTGAVILASTLIRDYLLNYARSLIYTTSLSYSNIIAADCAVDLLEDGTADLLAARLLNLSAYFVGTMRVRLSANTIPPDLLSLPLELQTSSAGANPFSFSPVVPLMTCHPRPLSAHLLALGVNARPITWPTVPKGKERVRVCLHSGNKRDEVDALVAGAVDWATKMVAWREKHQLAEADSQIDALLESKL